MWAWPAFCGGALLGLAILGVSLWALGVVKPRQNIEGWMVAAGRIPGAIAGVAIVFHRTRSRLLR